MVGTDLSPADIAAVTGNKNNDGNAWGGNGAWLWLIRMRRNTPCFSYGDISRSPFV